jgi:hypothetical protein
LEFFRNLFSLWGFIREPRRRAPAKIKWKPTD